MSTYIYPLQAVAAGLTMAVIETQEETYKAMDPIKKFVTLIGFSVFFGGSNLCFGLLSKSLISLTAKRLGYQSVGLAGNLIGGVLQAIFTLIFFNLLAKLANNKKKIEVWNQPLPRIFL